MAGAFDPSVHNFVNAGLAEGYVFTYREALESIKNISRENYTVFHTAAVLTGMAEIVIVRHVPGMAFGSFFQIIIPNHGWSRGHVGSSAAATC